MRSTLLRAALLTCAALTLPTAAFAEYRPGGAAPVEAYKPGAAGKKDQRPIIRVCTGQDDGLYAQVATMIGTYPGNPYIVQPVRTEGALENAQKVTDGTCEVGFTQADSLKVYRETDPRADQSIERALTMHKEFVHLLCNRDAKIGKLTDLKKGNIVAIGPAGSGAHSVWDAIVSTDKKKWAEVGTTDRSGLRALTAVQDGSEVTCALSVGALGNKTLRVDAQKFANKVVLVNVNEGVDAVKDASGKPIYTYAAIPNGTYGNLMPSGVLFGHNDAHTFNVDAVFIVNKGFADQNPKLYNAILQTVTNLQPKILEKAKAN